MYHNLGLESGLNFRWQYKVPNTDPTFSSDTVLVHYADYTEYSGLMFSNSQEISIGNNELRVNYAYTKTEIDAALDETIFEKP